MKKPLKTIALILARCGSKGLPRKNIRVLNGKPLIAWTIEASKQTRAIDRVIVSTDDQKIAGIAKRYGAEVPFIRPARFARDRSPALPAIQHAVSWIKENENYKPDVIVVLQPTSPLRKSLHIEKAIALLHKSKADSVVSVCPAEHSPYWMKTLKRGKVHDFIRTAKNYFRRQDLPPVYRLNGAVYVTRYKTLMHQHKVLGKNTRAIVMDAESSIDIDTSFDFKMAELILKQRKNA